MGSWIEVPIEGGAAPVYVATPASAGAAPGVVVVHHAGGVDEFVRKTCERLAEQGYVAAAPNLFHRQPIDDFEKIQAMPPGPDRRALLMSTITNLKDTEMTADVRGALRYLREATAVGQSPVGVIGFCMGGRVTFAMSTLGLGFAASAPFYPTNLTGPWDGGAPLVERAALVSCPIACFSGKDDTNPSPDVLNALAQSLTANGKPSEFHAYEDTEHLFMDPRGDRYRAHAAEDAWPKLLDFFGRYLKT